MLSAPERRVLGKTESENIIKDYIYSQIGQASCRDTQIAPVIRIVGNLVIY